VQVDDENHRPAKGIRGNAGRPRPGYATIVAAILAALAALAILLAALSATVWSDEPGPQTAIEAPSAGPPAVTPRQPPRAAPTTQPSSSRSPVRAPVPGRDPRHLTLVCWEPAGQLRADSSYSADANATSAPMTWLCATMSRLHHPKRTSLAGIHRLLNPFRHFRQAASDGHDSRQDLHLPPAPRLRLTWSG
jgi:hypothetical protein